MLSHSCDSLVYHSGVSPSVNVRGTAQCRGFPIEITCSILVLSFSSELLLL